MREVSVVRCIFSTEFDYCMKRMTGFDVQERSVCGRIRTGKPDDGSEGCHQCILTTCGVWMERSPGSWIQTKT